MIGKEIREGIDIEREKFGNRKLSVYATKQHIIHRNNEQLKAKSQGEGKEAPK